MESGGSYTAVGTYPHAEMVQLVTQLSASTQMEVPELLKAYGNHLFSTFVKGYGHFFQDVPDGFTFLERIEGYIHVEVRKLYPDAELPQFSHVRRNDHLLELTYTSERRMSDFAEGLLEACGRYFDERWNISKKKLDPSGTKVLFTIERND